MPINPFGLRTMVDGVASFETTGAMVARELSSNRASGGTAQTTIRHSRECQNMHYKGVVSRVSGRSLQGPRFGRVRRRAASTAFTVKFTRPLDREPKD
jgi:hypothetical protein